jgi:hypothetical protein
MNWAWASTLDQLWRSPAFPVWLTLAAAGFFAVIAVITLLRAEKSVANGALTVITLLAVGIALAATIRGFGASGRGAIADGQPSSMITASQPALACVDDLAGEVVLTACEKAVFGSPESTASALSYAARQISRLTSFGDVVAANKNMTPEIESLRQAVERDRYGLMAQVLVVRDHCTPFDCTAFRSLTDRDRISANIEERTYDGLIARYSAIWNLPPAVAAPAVAAVIPGLPTGKPTNAEFPSASSTPPVSIMTPEPSTATASRPTPPPAAATPTPQPRPTASASASSAPAPKKPPTPKPAHPTPTPAPATSLAPTQGASTD